MTTGFASGLRKYRVTIQNRKEAEVGKYGLDSSGIEWEDAGTVWAAVDWAKGKTALNAGAVDAYGVVIVRMNWNGFITMRSRMIFEGITYQILPDTFHPDFITNTIQFNAQAIVNPSPGQPATPTY
jgi:head-tail adaptor